LRVSYHIFINSETLQIRPPFVLRESGLAIAKVVLLVHVCLNCKKHNLNHGVVIDRVLYASILVTLSLRYISLGIDNKSS